MGLQQNTANDKNSSAPGLGAVENARKHADGKVAIGVSAVSEVK